MRILIGRSLGIIAVALALCQGRVSAADAPPAATPPAEQLTWSITSAAPNDGAGDGIQRCSVPYYKDQYDHLIIFADVVGLSSEPVSLRLAVDTGASRTVLTADACRRLGISPTAIVGPSPIDGVSAGSLAYAQIPDIRLTGLESTLHIRNMTVIVDKGSAISDAAGLCIDGVLGAGDVLNSIPFYKLDFGSEQIVFITCWPLDHGHKRAVIKAVGMSGTARIPMIFNDQSWFEKYPCKISVPTDARPVRCDMYFDTGLMQSLVPSTSGAGGRPGPDRVILASGTVSGAVRAVRLIDIGTLSAGQTVDALVSDKGAGKNQNSTLGLAALEHFDLLIDNVDHVLYIKHRDALIYSAACNTDSNGCPELALRLGAITGTFGLGTEANTSLVTQAFVGRCRDHVLYEGVPSIPGPGGTLYSPVVLGNVQIGNQIVRQLFLLASSAVPVQPGLDGILGLDFFETHSVLFDFVGHRVRLIDGDIDPSVLRSFNLAPQNNAHMFVGDTGALELRTEIKNGTRTTQEDAVLATGFPSAAISQAAASRLALHSTEKPITIQSGGPTLTIYSAVVGNYQIGSFQLTGCPVRWPNYSAVGAGPFVGGRFLSREFSSLLVDVPDRMLYGSPAHSPLPGRRI
jgi:predicted aspartyl protease